MNSILCSSHPVNIFDQVKLNVPIVEVVHRYTSVELQRIGTRLRGLCPLHSERTASFFIFPSDRFRCFGCGATGDSIDFVAKYFNLTLFQAAKKIAQDFGLEHMDEPLENAQIKQQYARKKQLSQALEIWRFSTAEKLTKFRRVATDILSGGYFSYLRNSEMVHLLPIVEYWLDLLETGTANEIIALWRTGNLEEFS